MRRRKISGDDGISMKNYRHLNEYSVFEINTVLEALRTQFDLVQLVDVEECRVLEVQPNGEIHYGRECYEVWGRSIRCAHCSGYQACMTHQSHQKYEKLNGKICRVNSTPIYLEMADGELELCVLDCVKLAGDEDAFTQTNEGLDYANSHDVLTQLYTQDRLYQEIRKKLIEYPDRKWLLVESNIRNFKLINKLFGIEGGNQALIGVAELLRKNCTHGEVYGRYRDDRFILLIQKERFNEAAIVEQLGTLKDVLESPMYTVYVQLGVYELTNVNMPITVMLDHTELALHTIEKSRKKNVAYYVEGMMEQKLKDQQIILEFEKNLIADQFQIFLQPQVLSDGTILGAEALARWIKPNGRIVPPAEFIPVLHQSDLLSHMDVVMWEKAVQVLASWKGTALENMYISINVDPSDFYYVDVPATVSGLCEKYGVDPKRLRIEITETALVNEVERENAIVEQLHEKGFIVEIDDFGKGSSSLSMLKDVNADVLKIDMGFVNDKSNRARSRVILESVIDMAHQLEMDVIAEGVETRPQVESLCALGCPHFQGFYFSRPIPVEDFEEVVRHHAER